MKSSLSLVADNSVNIRANGARSSQQFVVNRYFLGFSYFVLNVIPFLGESYYTTIRFFDELDFFGIFNIFLK